MAAIAAAIVIACLPASTRGMDVQQTWRVCHQQFDRQIPFAMTRNEEAVAFASVFANRWAPYGGQYRSDREAELLQAPSIACDAYAALTYYFADHILGRPPNVLLAGWYGGVVGNHAQVFAGRLTVDPTVAAVGYGQYRGVLNGRPEPWVVSFRVRTDLDAFNATVTEALLNGLYRPDDRMYLRTRPDVAEHQPVLADG